MSRMRLVEESAAILRANNWSLAVAESVTVGHLQAAIGGLSGASDFFHGGMTAYSLEQKVRQLGVHREAAAVCDCVSSKVAWQMARGVGELFSTAIAVATTGYAEPYPLQAIEIPFAYVAVWSRQMPDKVTTRKVLAPFPVDSRPDASFSGGATPGASHLDDGFPDTDRPQATGASARLDGSGDPRRSCQLYFVESALEALLQFLRDGSLESSG